MNQSRTVTLDTEGYSWKTSSFKGVELKGWGTEGEILVRVLENGRSMDGMKVSQGGITCLPGLAHGEV